MHTARATVRIGERESRGPTIQDSGAKEPDFVRFVQKEQS